MEEHEERWTLFFLFCRGCVLQGRENEDRDSTYSLV